MFKQMAKINKSAGEKNCLNNSGGKKQLVRHFTRNKFCKCIWCIILEVTYGIKVNQPWGKLLKISVRRGELN